MYTFLILYILLIIPAVNIKFDKSIIYFLGILFLIFISYFRDPLAATDAHNYFAAIESDEGNYLTSISPTFKILISIIKDYLGFGSLLTLQIISLVPFICFLISSIILNYPSMILIFLSSETFPLMSYNGIRQGLGLGFLMLTISILISKFLNNQKISNLKNLLSIKIPLIISFTSHISSLVISLLFISNIFFNKLKNTFSKYRIQKQILFLISAILILLVGIMIFRPGIFQFIIRRGINDFSLSFLVPKGFGYNQNHFSSIYRFIIMFAGYIYAKDKLNKVSESNLSNKKLIINLLDILNLSYLPLILFCILQSPVILSRLSHFYIISLSSSLFLANRIDKNKRLFSCSLISIMGLIAYSSSSVINNLISQ